MTRDEINQVATDLYKKYNTLDPYKLCKELGYEVIHEDMPSRLRGYTNEIKRIRFIHLNNLKSELEQYISCLHEIGHNVCKHDDNIIFHSGTTLHVTSKEENEANLFIIYYLLAPYTPMDLHGLTKEQIADMIGIEKELMRLL